MYRVHSGTRRVHTCMYSVQTRAIAMPLAIHCNIALLLAMPQAISPSAPSMYQGNFQQIPYVLGMAECSIGTYSSIVQYHLVLLCTSTYYLVQRFTILAVSAFRFGTTYVESWTVISAGVFYATGRHPFQYPKTKQISYLPGLAGDRFFYALGDSKLRRFFKTWMLND